MRESEGTTQPHNSSSDHPAPVSPATATERGDTAEERLLDLPGRAASYSSASQTLI